MSIDRIAKSLGSSESSISRYLDGYGVIKRTNTELSGGWNKGQPLPEHQRKLLSEIAKQRTGKKSPRYGAVLSKETRASIADSLKGRFRGAENPQWKGGRKYERTQWQSRFEYKEWRKAVFERDKYTCHMCGKPSIGNIEAHHIMPWRMAQESWFDVGNGITLCIPCHRSIMGKELEYVQQFRDAIHLPTP